MALKKATIVLEGGAKEAYLLLVLWITLWKRIFIFQM